MDRYRCQRCNKTFLTSEAIDGFKQGFTQGFLCPHCQCNLIEAGESNDILRLEYGFSYVILMLLLWLVVDQHYIAYTWPVADFINDLVTMAVAMCLPTLSFVLVNRKSLFSPRIIYTRKPILKIIDNKE